MKIQKEFDVIQASTTVRIEKTREDVTPIVGYKKFISKGIEIDGEVVNQRLETVLPENVGTTLFQDTTANGVNIKEAVENTTAKATVEYAEKTGQRPYIEMKYRQPAANPDGGSGSTPTPTPVTVAKPIISITSDGKVTITCATAGATIYYTINNTNPSDASTEYAGQFTLADSATVKAIAYATIEGEEKVSAVVSKTYTKQSTPPQPTTFTVYHGVTTLDYDGMSNQNTVGTYLEGAVTAEVIKGLTRSVVSNQYQDYSFTGTDEDDDHISTAIVAFPSTAEPILPGIMFNGEIKQSSGYHKFNVEIDGVDYVVFALKGGLADSGSTADVYFRASFN